VHDRHAQAGDAAGTVQADDPGPGAGDPGGCRRGGGAGFGRRSWRHSPSPVVSSLTDDCCSVGSGSVESDPVSVPAGSPTSADSPASAAGAVYSAPAAAGAVYSAPAAAGAVNSVHVSG